MADLIGETNSIGSLSSRSRDVKVSIPACFYSPFHTEKSKQYSSASQQEIKLLSQKVMFVEITSRTARGRNIFSAKV